MKDAGDRFDPGGIGHIAGWVESERRFERVRTFRQKQEGNRLHHQRGEMESVGEDGEIRAKKGRKRLLHAGCRGFTKTFFEAFESALQRLGNAASALLNPKRSQIAAPAVVEERLTVLEVGSMFVAQSSQKTAALRLRKRRDFVLLESVGVPEPFPAALQVRETVLELGVVPIHDLLAELLDRSKSSVREEGLRTVLHEKVRDVHGERMGDGGAHDAVGGRAVAHSNFAPQIVAKKQPGNPRFDDRFERVVSTGILAGGNHFSDLLVCL